MAVEVPVEVPVVEAEVVVVTDVVMVVVGDVMGVVVGESVAEDVTVVVCDVVGELVTDVLGEVVLVVVSEVVIELLALVVALVVTLDVSVDDCVVEGDVVGLVCSHSANVPSRCPFNAALRMATVCAHASSSPMMPPTEQKTDPALSPLVHSLIIAFNASDPPSHSSAAIRNIVASATSASQIRSTSAPWQTCSRFSNSTCCPWQVPASLDRYVLPLCS